MSNRVALIVGRFQPFHKGHLYLIKKALEKAEKIVFGIGSASIYNEDNPLSFEQRKLMIIEVIRQEKIENRVLKIVALEDFFDNEKWLKNLEKQVGKFDLSLGNNDWTNDILEKAGHQVLRVDYYKRLLYEGWRIRKLIRENMSWQDRVPKYLIKEISNKISNFRNVVVGGTFDHFHLGHKVLLDKAFEVGKKVVIGIATGEIYKNKFLSETIEPFKIRKESVEKYIKKYLIDGRMVDIISFSHFTGGVDKSKDIEAIVVSKITYPNALKINRLRDKNKLPLLRIIIIDDILAQDGKLISSERIRAGEIDRNGDNYQLSIINNQNKELIMPESLRPRLQKPLGKIYQTTRQIIVGANLDSPKKPIMIIAVGDIIVNSLLNNRIDPDVKIIDFRSRREPIKTDAFIKDSLYKDCLYLNNPGTINLKTAEIIKEKIKLALYKKVKSWIVINGEEDLLALPAILFAPLKSLVLYGHWQLGIIAVEVTEASKNMAFKIISKFISK